MGRKADLESDSKYRAYSAAIEKCLKSFEYSSEWPDLISSLVRLMKLIQQYDRYDVIPKKRLLGKRLAQCLHHALPPGVHCKTLECFDLIFRIMGPENLAIDIGVYGPSLFGLLGPSAMTVKPLLFNIFETYLLPLGDKLKTSFLGLLQGLLPGLEEGSEFFERGNGMIEEFCRVIGPEFFYGSLWQVLIQAPSVRHFGIAYIINHFNKRRHLSAQAYVFGTSTNVLLESVRCLLGDSVVLVQRDTLDFVILALPIHLVASISSPKQYPKRSVNFNQHPLQGRISRSQMRDLVAASLTVLLRKDASLNRRLFIWLLGSQNMELTDASQGATTVARVALSSSEIQNDPDSTIQQEYFKRFSLPMVTEALHTILKATLASSSVSDIHSANRNVCFRPFRLMGGLLNRSEIGSLLVEQVLVDFIFFTLYMYQKLGGDGSNSSSGEKSPVLSASPSVASSPIQRRVHGRHLPQQTVEMLVQYESYADDCGNKNTTSHTSSKRSNHNTRRRSSRLSNDRRLRLRSINTENVNSSTIDTNSNRQSTETEFMREAELFFSNLESGFLWPFLQEHFFVSPTKIHPGWISAVRFLVEHLPIDTYPDVRGYHLPRMVSAVSKTMCERMGQLSLADFSEFVDLLGVLIGHIQEHMATMLDQALAEASRPFVTGSPRVSSTSVQRDREILVIAKTVGDMRHLLAAFFKQYLTSSSNTVEDCMKWLRSPEKDLHSLENEFSDFMNPNVPEKDRPAVVDLLAQLCRLVVDMCNVPIVQPSESSSEEFDFNRLFNSGPGDEKNFLPEWLAYLVVSGALSADFDTKTICLHTILDLVEASTSIYGWTSCIAPNGRYSKEKHALWGPSGLLLPVLAIEVLSTLASTLDFFPLTAVSLWSFMNDSTHAEDAASLIARVITVSPNNEYTSTEALVENFFVQQMLSSHPHLRLEAHRRFALLWRFLRHSPTVTGAEKPSISGGLNCDSLTLSSSMTGWRRAAMGLPIITNEIAPEGPNFNRCLLILLDSLEDSNLKSGSTLDGLPRSRSSITSTSPEAGVHLQTEIQQTTTAWLFTALSSGQAGRVVAPLFSTLLHPSVARTSLTSIRNRRRRLGLAKKRRIRKRLRQTGDVQMPVRKGSDVDGVTEAKNVRGSEEESDDDVGYEDLDNDLDLNNASDGDEWEEYDRNICALSGGSPSGELHFYVTKNKSQTPPREPERRKKRLGVFSKTPVLRRKKKGAEDGDVFDDEYHPVDVMTQLQSGDCGADTGVDDTERVSLDRIRRDVIQANGRCRALLSDLLKSEPDGGKATASKNVSPFDQLVTSPVKVLPVHEHLLVYLHKYDFNLVMYAFSKLRAILKSDAGSLFLLALAASPTMGKKFSNSVSKQKHDVPHFVTCEFPKLFGTNLLDLLARHYRCLFGGGCDDFARPATADELNSIFDLRMPSLLDVLLYVCISFLLSFILPNSQSSMDAAANANVRLLAAEILQLITEKLLYLSQILNPGEGKNSKLDSHKGCADMVALVSALHESSSLWIDTAIQRSGLSQAVLHSLATFTEMSQLTDNSLEVEDCLPLCMRLLKSNCCTEGSSFLWILLKITDNLLQLTEPLCQTQTKSSTVASTPAGGRGSRNSPSAETAAARNNETPSKNSTQLIPGTLPWCVLGASTIDVVTLKYLAAQKFSPALLTLLATSYLDGSSKADQMRLRHIATQSLLLNTIRLALNPTGRVDLHPLWYGFLRKTLIHWGSATAFLINIVASQMAAAIQLLAEPFCHALMPIGMTERLPPEDYPTDYTVHLFACLQGIIHTYLLPFGQSKSTLMHGMVLGTTAFVRDGSPLISSRPSPAHRGKSYINGSIHSVFETPEALRDSLRVAEALENFHSTNQAFEYAPLGQALQRMQSAYSEDPAMPSNLSSAAAILFATRDFLGTEVMPISTSYIHDWARGRAEMCHVFPALLSSLAAIWFALNQSPDPRNSQLSNEDSENSFIETGIDALNGDAFISNSELSLRLRCGFDRLDALTTLGYPDTVRQTIRGLLEPIASTHPALLLTALANAWPPILSQTANGANMDVMWLLSSSPMGLPLTVRQCALVSLISGAHWGFQEIGNGSGRYVAVSNLSNADMEKPSSLLKTPLAVKTLRNLLRSPSASMAYAYTVDLPNCESATSSPTDAIVSSQMIQSSLLHFLYAWMVATGGIGASFHLASVQDFLRDVVPLTSVSAAVSTTSGLGTAITSPVSVFLLVKIFNEIIATLANKDEKRDQKDLQDICQRLMETTASIAGTALEQATWFRRSLQVRSYASTTASLSSSALEMSASVGALRVPDLMLHPSASETASVEIKLNGLNTPPGVLQDSQEIVSIAENREFKAEDLSVLALRMLAEHMAVFFDVVYRSDEKDRVPSALNNGILTNILPFLKSHNIGNVFHYNAASQVLASLSSYQFTRRAWRRDVFELFIDATFFQATAPALHSWRAVVDNLMTQEKNTFKEALTRLTVSQGAGLNIFSSKEAECEQRAAHLKKISFIVFASERDQYSRSISEILERLTDNLRAMTDLNVPILTQLFLCARVLAARISSESLASLWLIVIPELVNVFRIFAERFNESSRKRSPLKFEELQKLSQSQLTLLLSASKLLATILLLPESRVPQLLFYRWVFVNRGTGTNQGMDEKNELDNAFHPLMDRISSGLASIYQRENQIYTAQLLSVTNACYLILSTKSVTDFERLELFFRSLGEKRGVADASSEVLDDASLNTLNQVLEVSTFNEFPEPLMTSK